MLWVWVLCIRSLCFECGDRSESLLHWELGLKRWALIDVQVSDVCTWQPRDEKRIALRPRIDAVAIISMLTSYSYHQILKFNFSSSPTWPPLLPQPPPHPYFPLVLLPQIIRKTSLKFLNIIFLVVRVKKEQNIRPKQSIWFFSDSPKCWYLFVAHCEWHTLCGAHPRNKCSYLKPSAVYSYPSISCECQSNVTQAFCAPLYNLSYECHKSEK